MGPRSARAPLLLLALVLAGCDGPGMGGLDRDPAASPAAPPEEGPDEGAGSPAGGPRVAVIRVVDGDTFHVVQGSRDVTIRLIGIDTPEVGWYGGQAECLGAAAGLFLRRLLDGAEVRLEFDAERIDPYGRTLAYAYLGDGRMVNLLLVRRGLARVTIYEPNDRYEPELLGAQATARSEGDGLWSACV